MTDDDPIRTVIKGLSRHHSSGGEVIERAAILAAGGDSAAILAWIADHDGQPEALAPARAAAGGLHGGRLHGRAAPASVTPQRYVLPPGVLA